MANQRARTFAQSRLKWCARTTPCLTRHPNAEPGLGEQGNRSHRGLLKPPANIAANSTSPVDSALALKRVAARAVVVVPCRHMSTLPDRLLTPHEVSAVAKARRILERWGLENRPIDEALAQLRQQYRLERNGLQDYICAMLGPLANLPARRFELFADPSGQRPLPLPERSEQKIADYLAATFQPGNIPGLIRLVRGREGDEREFWL